MDQGLALLAAWAQWFALVGLLGYLIAHGRGQRRTADTPAARAAEQVRVEPPDG